MTERVVSVLIPCRNAARTLGATLRSVRAQTWKHVQIIVVDDGSTDASRAVAEATLEGYPGVYAVVPSAGQGANHARTTAYGLATGDFIQWLDADDLLGPHKLERQAQALRSNPMDDIAYGDWLWYQVGPKMDAEADAPLPIGVPAIAYGERPWRRHRRDPRIAVGRFRTGPSQDVTLRLLMDFWAPPHAYLLRRRAAEWLDQNEAWHPEATCAQDREYFTSAAVHGCLFLHVPGFDTAYFTRNAGEQITRRMGARERANALRALHERVLSRARRANAPSLSPDHRFLLTQDRRIWRPKTRFGGLLRMSSTEARWFSALTTTARETTLEQHAKWVAWLVPGAWEQHLSILRGLGRLAEAGAFETTAGAGGN